LLKNFKPSTLTDPQQLPAGSYDLKVVKAGDGATAMRSSKRTTSRFQEERTSPLRLISARLAGFAEPT